MAIKSDVSFIDKVLLAFKKINSEITIDSLEHDFSPSPAKDMGLSTPEHGFKSRWEHSGTGVIYRLQKCPPYFVVEAKICRR